MIKLIKLFFAFALPLLLVSCTTKAPEIEMIDILSAHVDNEGYLVVNFQLTNSQKETICVPQPIIETSESYYAILDIRTKKGYRLKERRFRDLPAAGSQEQLRVQQGEDRSNTIKIKRNSAIKWLNKEKNLTFGFKFYAEFCENKSRQLPAADAFVTSNRVKIQQ